MIFYQIENRNFGISYRELMCDYERFTQMTDEEWIKPETILDLLHFCCIVGYLKELSNEELVSDMGIVHELVHLAKGAQVKSLREIREQFARVTKLI